MRIVWCLRDNKQKYLTYAIDRWQHWHDTAILRGNIFIVNEELRACPNHFVCLWCNRGQTSGACDQQQPRAHLHNYDYFAGTCYKTNFLFLQVCKTTWCKTNLFYKLRGFCRPESGILKTKTLEVVDRSGLAGTTNQSKSFSNISLTNQNALPG